MALKKKEFTYKMLVKNGRVIGAVRKPKREKRQKQAA